MAMNERIKVAVIDTYVNTEHTNFSGVKIHIPESYVNTNKNSITHGDLVCSVLVKECMDVDITLYPIFDSDSCDADIEDVIKVLTALKQEKYDVINLSMGTCYTDFYYEFEEVCNQISETGTVIVSAYDNNGMLSLPAVFDNVIGVDACDKSLFGYDYIFEENSIMNIRGSSNSHRVNIDSKFTIVSGSSFFAPYITGIIANWMIKNNKKYSYEEVMNFLRSKSKKIINFNNLFGNRKYGGINKAIVLPFNKENHSLARFADKLNITIEGFYDFKHFLNCGKNVNQIIHSDLKNDYVIKNINKINWEDDFDTLVLGHIKDIIEIIGDDIIVSILHNCKLYNKRIYSYDNFLLKKYPEELQGIDFFYPGITADMLPQGRQGKLWDISTPVLGVFGTRTQQGKFTLQQLIRYQMMEMGYNCGYLATEPNGFLFGADEVFAYGYNSSVELSDTESVVYLNELLHIIDLKRKDIIITGGQSGIVPYDYGNMARILTGQTSFMFGTHPDAAIVCVCYDDELSYIYRSIQYLESGCDTKVIALMLFPVKKQMYFTGLYKDVNIENSEEYDKCISNLKCNFNLPVYGFGKEGIMECVNKVIDFF